MVYLADLTWDNNTDQELKNYSKGQEIEVVILNIETEKERISLGIKQLVEDDFSLFLNNHKKGTIAKGTIKEVDAYGAKVDLGNDIEGYIKAGEISEDRVDDASTVLKKDQEVEALIIRIDRKTRNISLSMKQKNIVEEKNAMDDYNAQSTNTAASTLGDLLKQAKET